MTTTHITLADTRVARLAALAERKPIEAIVATWRSIFVATGRTWPPTETFRPGDFTLPKHQTEAIVNGLIGWDRANGRMAAAMLEWLNRGPSSREDR